MTKILLKLTEVLKLYMCVCMLTSFSEVYTLIAHDKLLYIPFEALFISRI